MVTKSGDTAMIHPVMFQRLAQMAEEERLRGFRREDLRRSARTGQSRSLGSRIFHLMHRSHPLG